MNKHICTHYSASLFIYGAGILDDHKQSWTAKPLLGSLTVGEKLNFNHIHPTARNTPIMGEDAKGSGGRYEIPAGRGVGRLKIYPILLLDLFCQQDMKGGHFRGDEAGAKMLEKLPVSVEGAPASHYWRTPDILKGILLLEAPPHGVCILSSAFFMLSKTMWPTKKWGGGARFVWSFSTLPSIQSGS